MSAEVKAETRGFSRRASGERAIAGDAGDAVLLLEKVKRLDGLVRQTDNALRRKHTREPRCLSACRWAAHVAAASLRPAEWIKIPLHIDVLSSSRCDASVTATAHAKPPGLKSALPGMPTSPAAARAEYDLHPPPN